jgi:hypothetical protein
MHQTTYNYLRTKLLDSRPKKRSFISDSTFYIEGFEIVVSDVPSPTIHETTEWIFPHNSLFSYEASDEEWCRYFGIGRQGRGLVIGDIYEVNGKPYGIDYLVGESKPCVREFYGTKPLTYDDTYVKMSRYNYGFYHKGF